VAAVAVAVSADTVLTINVKDFRSWLLEGAGITIMPSGQLVEGVTMETAMGRVRSGWRLRQPRHWYRADGGW
jgi:hypothetical protein